MAIPNLGTVVASLSTAGTFTLRVTPARSYDPDGRLQSGPATDTAFTGSVQPAGAEEVRDEAGNYAQHALKVWSYSGPVLPSRDGYEADRVLWDGIWYEVSRAENWFPSGGGYCYAECIQEQAR